jgi:hypothetical protein
MVNWNSFLILILLYIINIGLIIIYFRAILENKEKREKKDLVGIMDLKEKKEIKV